jgi:hypothetical protein
VKIRIAESEIDINDDEQIMAACEALAAADVKRIPTNYHTRALTAFIQNLRYWYAKNGAQLVAATAGGYSGVGIVNARQAHDFIGAMLGEPRLNLEAYEPQAEEPEAGPNDVVEGDEVPGPATPDEL